MPIALASAHDRDRNHTDRHRGATMTITADCTRTYGLPGPTEGSEAVRGLTRRAAGPDPAGWVERKISVPGEDEETRRRKALFTLALILLVPFGVVWAG